MKGNELTNSFGNDMLCMHRIAGGFSSIRDAFPSGSSQHVPFNVESRPFSDFSQDCMLSVQTYAQFEKAISALPTPLLISCKSGARASAVAAAYNGVQNRLTWEQVFKQGEALGE